jgi:hypothetical protein
MFGAPFRTPPFLDLQQLLLIAVWIAMTVVGFIVTGLVKSDLLNKGNPIR